MEMRANLNLDTEAYAFASTYANARGIPLGRAVSELLLSAEHGAETRAPRLVTSKLGLLVRPKDGSRTTPEMVKKYSEDDYE